MSEEPGVDELKDRIAQTRSDLGETVEALAAKADVKARASGAVHDAVDGVKAKAAGLVGGAKAKAQDAVGAVKSSTGNAVEAAKSSAGNAVEAAKSSAQGAVEGAKDAASGVQDRARGLVGRDRPGEALVLPGDTALVTPAGPALDRRLQGVLMATAVGAVIGALVIWLTGRRS
jgi:uncharacterized protein YjbJ (UPF0337 family)